jgi:hypothetical protein
MANKTEADENEERACKAADLAKKIEEEISLLTEEGLYMECSYDEDGKRVFGWAYNPQVSHRALRLLAQSYAAMRQAIDEIKW